MRTTTTAVLMQIAQSAHPSIQASHQRLLEVTLQRTAMARAGHRASSGALYCASSTDTSC